MTAETVMSSRTEVLTEHAPDQRASQEGSGSDGHGNSSHSGGESQIIFFKTLTLHWLKEGEREVHF